jgi:cytoskeletal protein RodZ
MTIPKVLAAPALLAVLFLADGSSVGSLTLVRDAHAVVGAPATPMSYAGVARRTTRRAVAATTSAATTTAAATSSQQAATAQQQQAVAQQQAATAKQQQAVATQQSVTAAQQAQAARPAGAPPVGTVVPSLPGGCKSAPKDGVDYQDCGGVLYRSAFQGNNLVYVVQ